MGDVERLKVHSWHINIGVGDGAIHLLVDEKATLPATTAVKPLVKKAVLIDGGDSAHSLQQLKLTIARIEAEYDFPAEDAKQLKFDAILITHWDLDHWYGIHQLLLEDLEATLNANENYKALIENSNAAWRKSIVTYVFNKTDKKVQLSALKTKTDFDNAYATLVLSPQDKVQYTNVLLEMGDAVPDAPWNFVDTCSDTIVIRSRYLKYGNAYSNEPQFFPGNAVNKADLSTNKNQMLTSFYVPHQCEVGRIGPPPGKFSGGTFFSSNENGKYTLKKDRKDVQKSNLNWLTINMATSYQLKVPEVKELDSGKLTADAKHVEPEYVKEWKVLYCSKLCADFEDYLGAEIFYGTNVTGAWRTCTNPGKLLKAVNLSPAMGPRMFIVAGDQVVIGETPLAQASRAAKPPEIVINTEDKLLKRKHFAPPLEKIIDIFSPEHLGVRYTGDFRDSSHDRNSASLICVILNSNVLDWTAVTTKEQERDSFLALYYSGGDALYDEEGAVASWLQDPDAKWNLLPMRAMKLSQ